MSRENNTVYTAYATNATDSSERWDGEFCLPLEEQMYNVRSGVCLLEMRDALQGGPGLIFPSADELLTILRIAQQCGITESTVSIQTGNGTIIDETTRELLLKLRDIGSGLIPSFAIPSTAKGAATAENLIVNYHRGLEIKVFISAAEERMKVHGWTIDRITQQSKETIQYLTDRYPNKVVSVIEQASQASDQNLFNMIDMSAEANASGVCLADTLSFFDQEQAFTFILKIRRYIYNKATWYDAQGNTDLANRYRKLRLEYHGHNDFGNASEAALGAMRAGAVVHVTPGSPHGIGERAGNASLKDTYRKANEFLQANGSAPVKPVDAVDLLDKAFVQATRLDPSKYGPEGENANTTCAALHADYILKIWKKLEAVKVVLEAAKKNATKDIVSEDSGNVNEIWDLVAPDIIAQLESQVEEYTRLLKEGYLPRKGENSYGEHKFALNPYSNEDTVRMYFHALTGLSPYMLPQKNADYILWVIKHLNRPLTPLEVSHFFMIDSPPHSNYPWDYVDKTHPLYG